MSTRSKKPTSPDALVSSQSTRPVTRETEPARREEEIAVSGYCRAEARGFAAGGELEDWLKAEQEVTADDAATK